MGVHVGQGYLYAKRIPKGELIALMAAAWWASRCSLRRRACSRSPPRR
jgi:sensor c-di-GMP phosphodiesterase-like protein